MVCWLVPATAAVKPIVGERDVYTYAYLIADGIVYALEMGCVNTCNS